MTARVDLFAIAVEAIYGAALAPLRWPEALVAIADVFGDVGAILLYQKEDGSLGTVVSPGLESTQRDYQDGEWWRHDIGMQRALELRYLATSDVVSDRDVASEEEMASHPFFRDFLIPHGLGWFAGISVSPDPRATVVLTIQRSRAKAPFSDEERGTIERLGRHVESALRLGIRAVNNRVAASSVGEALSHLGFGVFLVDADGRIVLSNALGEAALGGRLVLRQGRLRAVDPGDDRALHDALLGTAAGQPDGGAGARPILIRAEHGGPEVAVYVLPARLSLTSIFERLMADVRSVVLLIPVNTAEPDPALVRDLLDLTLGEAKIASLIGSGIPPRQAAERLGITEETARSVLKRVFAKTGVSRQSELAGLITRLVLK